MQMVLGFALVFGLMCSICVGGVCALVVKDYTKGRGQREPHHRIRSGVTMDLPTMETRQ